ncbi:MAG: FapA family protein [Oscillospiraceae bacterium]
MADEKEVGILTHAAVEISVDPNYTTAFMSLSAPSGGGLEMTFDKAMRALDEKKISFGIDEEAVRDMVDNKRYDENICVARWAAPVDGADGVITYKFNMDSVARPVEDENGVVDYKNLGLVRNITSGTVIATITMPTEGTPGRDITGRTVGQRKGVPARYTVGKGTALVNNESEIIAAVDGNLVYNNGAFCVEEELIIKEDVDVSSGNIDFIGNVVIRGSVFEGFKVTSKKNITVNGSVNGAELSAQGDITVKLGVVNSVINAKGSVKAGFCENSKITADKNVESASFVGGEVFAGGNISATGKGVMVGGKYTALDNIEAGTVGSDNYTRTLITLGNNAVLSEERDTLQRSIAEMEGKIDQLGKILDTLTELAKKSKLSPEREQLKAEAVRNRLKMQMEIKKNTQRIEQINQTLLVNQTLSISVRKAFYPGVTLRINDCVLAVNVENSRCRATIENAEIVFKPF